MTDFQRRVIDQLALLYPEEDLADLAVQLITAMGLSVDSSPVPRHQNLWDESDNVLITYGDSIVRKGEKPLVTLKRFIDTHLKDSITAVHILPFFPYSSDDGFSVINYLLVNQSLGEWEDISAIASDYQLMIDLVINHVSSQSRWFENFKKCIDPGKDYFIEVSPDDDVSQVVRPRNSALLTPVEKADGTHLVWCTFSPDQVDMNLKNPLVLLEFVRIIRSYLEYGAKIFRIDAAAFLWKKVGTSCIHLEETHALIKLLRTLIEHHSHDAIIITETNVPNRENLTYFGNANEGHIIYNFSLPPLLLYTLVSGDCGHLKTWMMSMPPAQSGTTYLNFIASHDGIGLRPLDGLVSDIDREKLIEAMQSFGGQVTMRKTRQDHDEAYEINIALYDALKGTIDEGPDQWQHERFICAHAIMLALEGIPAFYIHSLFGTENDNNMLEQTGSNRSINRHVWQADDLQALLNNSTKHYGRVFEGLTKLIKLRCHQPAFHPNATQFTLHLGACIFAFWRQSSDRKQSIFCLNNITNQDLQVNLSDINFLSTGGRVDLITGKHYSDLDSQVYFTPYQTIWLTNPMQ